MSETHADQKKDVLVDQIVTLEWSMFSAVPNTGGQASCQTDPETFRIMRQTQVETWPAAMRESYLADLRAATREGRNLMTEKYARMMESTHPREFARVAASLPDISPAVRAQVEEIVAAHVAWKQDLSARFPLLNSRGRAIRSAEDSAAATSFETYLRGELLTCSPGTIRLCLEHTRDSLAQGRNLVEANLLKLVQAYGNHSLETAEQVLRNNG